MFITLAHMEPINTTRHTETNQPNQSNKPVKYPKDIQWCLENKTNLDFVSFANKFEFIDMSKSYKRYRHIIKYHFKDDRRLKQDFSIWRHSRLAIKFWEKATTQAAKDQLRLVTAKTVFAKFVKDAEKQDTRYRDLSESGTKEDGELREGVKGLRAVVQDASSDYDMNSMEDESDSNSDHTSFLHDD